MSSTKSVTHDGNFARRSQYVLERWCLVKPHPNGVRQQLYGRGAMPLLFHTREDARRCRRENYATYAGARTARCTVTVNAEVSR